MKTTLLRHFAAAFIAATLLTAPAAHAQTTYSWSTNGTTTNGGSGTWDLVLSNWYSGAKAKWPSSGTANIANFAGTAGTVTNAADVSANQLRFNANSYVLQTDGSTRTITLNGTAPEINVVTNTHTATLGNNTALVLAGTAGLTKTGAGTLILNGSTANSFTGGLNVKSGGLTLSYANMATPTDLINSANALTLGGLGASSTLSLLGKATGTTSQTFAGTTASVGNTTIGMNRNGGTSTTLNLGQLTLNTGSVLFFTNTTAWTTTPSTTEIVKLTTGGTVTVPGSGVAYASAKMMNNTGSSTRWVQVDTNGQLVNMPTSTALAATSADPTVGNSIGSSDVTFSTPTASSYGLLDNANGATRNIFITNGVTYTLNGIIGIGSATLNITNTGTGSLVIGAEKEMVINLATSSALNIYAPIVNNGGGASALTVASTSNGITTLAGSSTYTGYTTINSGTLQIGGGGTTGALSTSSDIRNYGTLIFNRSDTITQGTDFSANISGTGGLIKLGAGVLVMNGSGNTYTGATTLSNGTLKVGSSTAFNGTGRLTPSTSVASTFDLNGFDARFTFLDGGATASVITNSGAGAGTNTLTIAMAANFNGLIADGATAKTAIVMTNAGSGSFYNTNNTFSGGLLVSGLSKIAIVNGTVGSGDSIINGPYGRGTITLGSSPTDGGQIYNASAGTWTLANNVIVNNAVSVGSVPGAFRMENGTYNFTGNIIANMTNAVFVNWGQFGGGSSTNNLQGAISGNYGLDVYYNNNNATARVFTVNMASAPGTNSYNGNTIIRGGNAINVVTLKLGANDQIPDGANKGILNINASTAIFDLNGYSDTINGLTGSGIVDNVAGGGTSTLTIGANNTNSTFTGVISNTTGTVNITKNGTGTLTLSGANSYTGTTTVSAGVLVLTNGGAIADTGAVSLSNVAGATLLVATNETIGSLQGGGAAGGNVSIASGTTLTVAETNSQTFAGVISNASAGAGALTKSGAGTTILSGANTYSGATTISAGGGLLQFAKATALYNSNTASWDKTKITVNSGSTIGFNVGGTDEFSTADVTTILGGLGGAVNNNGLRGGSAIAFDTANAAGGNFSVANNLADSTGTGGGSLGVTKLGANTLTLSGNNTFSGALDVRAGTLQLASTSGAAAGGTTSVSIAANATLLIGQSNQLNNVNAAITLSGGTIQRASGVSEVFGNLNIGAASTLDFGTGTGGTLQFQNYANTGSSLVTVQNFFPGNKLQFTSSSFGTGDLVNFSFGSFGYSTGTEGSYFTITAIPEPTTVIAAIGLTGLFLWPMRRRLMSRGKGAGSH